MAFTTENRKVENIFQRAAIYIVPRYQRDYVWKEINWKELWIDLQFTLQNMGEIPWSHFLGTIVLNQTKNKENGLDLYEIIDGQQRLMTLYLLLIAIYKNFKRIGRDEKQDISNYIYNTFLTSLTKGSEKKIMIDNQLYNEDLYEIIDAATENKNIDKKNKLYAPFMYFDSKLKDKEYKYLDSLLNKLLSVNVVEIISGEDEEIYNIFEVLNARGQKLKQIELLKNHIMKYIQPRETCFIDKAKNKWRNIQSNIDHLNDPDVLIQHFAKCYIEKNAENQNSIYRLIKEEIKIDDLSLFLNDLEEFSKLYRKISKNDSENDVIKYFNIKRNQQIRSLLCAIFILKEKNIITEETKNSSLIQLLNFFFIFNTTQQTSNRTDNIISSISYEVYKCKEENQFKALFSEFMYELENYIKNKDYKSMFEINQSFKYSNKDRTLKRNSKLVKYLLERIFREKQKDAQIDSNTLTIEHLMSDNGSLDSSSIWNLTLTNEEINSNILRNKPINQKIKILKEQSNIKVNQELDRYFLEGKFDYEQRKQDMLNIIFDKVFVFNPQIFGFSIDDVNEYKRIKKIILKHKDKEMLNELQKHGKHFFKKLENDPTKKSFLDKWLEYEKEKDK